MLIEKKGTVLLYKQAAQYNSLHPHIEAAYNKLHVHAHTYARTNTTSAPCVYSDHANIQLSFQIEDLIPFNLYRGGGMGSLVINWNVGMLK